MALWLLYLEVFSGSQNSLQYVNLKKNVSQVLIQQKGFIQEKENTAIQYRHNGEPHTSPQNREEETLL